MKNKTTFCLISLILLLLFTLSACGDMRYSVDINENGGSIEIAMLQAKEAYEEVMSSEEYYAAFLESGLKLELCTIDGTEYTKMYHTIRYSSLEELCDRLNQESPRIVLFKDVQITANRSKQTLTMTGSVRNFEPEYLSSVIVVLKFPGAITEYNIGTKIDDTTLEIDLMEYWVTGTEASFSITAHTRSWSDAVLLLCIVAVVGAFVFYKKPDPSERSSNAMPVSDENRDAEPQETADTECQEHKE